MSEQKSLTKILSERMADPCPVFQAEVIDKIPEKHWTKVDLAAVRFGWEAARYLHGYNQTRTDRDVKISILEAVLDNDRDDVLHYATELAGFGDKVNAAAQRDFAGADGCKEDSV
jgi:hypothetical protein